MVYAIDAADRPRVVMKLTVGPHRCGQGRKCRVCGHPFPCKAAALACDSFINIPAAGAVK